MSVRIIKQKQEQQIKNSSNGEAVSQSPVLIESVLLLIPDQSQPTPIVSFERSQQAGTSSFTINNDFEPSHLLSALEQSSLSNTTRRSASQRVHVPVHNASQWFNGPDMQNERTGRMEKVVASLVRRSYRPLSSYAYVVVRKILRNSFRFFRMPRVPTLTSPSSRDHAHYKGKHWSICT